jgi:hypothetical protein
MNCEIDFFELIRNVKRYRDVDLQNAIACLDRKLTVDDLIVAITCKNAAAIEILLDNNCEWTHVAIAIAMQTGDLKVIKAFETRGFDMSQASRYSNIVNNPDTVRYLLQTYPHTFGDIFVLARKSPQNNLETMIELYFANPDAVAPYINKLELVDRFVK